MIANLKKLRISHGLSQQQLAEHIGVSQQSINKYENHAIEPDINTLIALADLFGTSVDYLIGHTAIERRIEPVQTCDLNEAEMQLVEHYRKLSPKQKGILQNTAEAFLQK